MKTYLFIKQAIITTDLSVKGLKCSATLVLQRDLASHRERLHIFTMKE